MALPKIHAGGGRLYFGDSATDDWVEVALVQSFDLKSTSGSDEVMDWSDGLPRVFDSFINKFEVSVDFMTKEINIENMSKAFLANVQTGLDNPLTGGIDGATKVSKIEIGNGQQYQGGVKFESENIRGPKKVLILHKVSISPDASLSFIGDKAMEIKFSGKAGIGEDRTHGYILVVEE